jgi:hypothetical protein
LRIRFHAVRDRIGHMFLGNHFAETVAERGYRFLLPVETITAIADVSGAAPAPPTPPANIDRRSAPHFAIRCRTGSCAAYVIYIANAF